MKPILAMSDEQELTCPSCESADIRYHGVKARLLWDMVSRVRLIYAMWHCKACKKRFMDPAALHFGPARRRFTWAAIAKITEIRRDCRTAVDAVRRIQEEMGLHIAMSTLVDLVVDFSDFDRWRMS